MVWWNMKHIYSTIFIWIPPHFIIIPKLFNPKVSSHYLIAQILKYKLNFSKLIPTHWDIDPKPSQIITNLAVTTFPLCTLHGGLKISGIRAIFLAPLKIPQPTHSTMKPLVNFLVSIGHRPSTYWHPQTRSSNLHSQIRRAEMLAPNPFP